MARPVRLAPDPTFGYAVQRAPSHGRTLLTTRRAVPQPDRLRRVDEVLVERVLRAVEQVPPGRVVSYGDLGALVGTGPRHVGRIMAQWGANVAWWRVTSRDGDLAGDLLARARPHWEEEGIEVKENGRGCRFTAYQVDLEQLAHAYGRVTADLGDTAG